MKYKPDVPHDDEIVWDAHDRVVERSLRMKAGEWDGSSEAELYSRRVWTFAGFLFIGLVLFFGFLYLKQTTEPVRYVTQTYEFDGNTYICTHYPDGGMDCHLDGDEDVGFGRMP